MSPGWKTFAVGSAFFAALTAIFGKIGVGEMNSDLATFLRTLVILLLSAAVVTTRGEWQRPGGLSSMGAAAIVLSGIATGLSWLCYYRALQLAPASRVAPVDKLSVVFVVVLGVAFLNEKLSWQVGLGAAFVSLGAILMVI
jgi:bacterial/archaeal transporter family protein